MSTVAVQSCIPRVFEAGETIRYTTSDGDYSALLWTLQVALNNGVTAPTLITATANGTGFDVVISAAVSATLTPGTYRASEVFTAISPTTEKAIGRTDIVDVLPNPSVTATPSYAQAQVTLLETAITSLGSAGGFTSVSFNGQSFSIDNIDNYRSQLVYWQSRVIAEKRRLDALRGEYQGGHIPVIFLPALPEERSA